MKLERNEISLMLLGICHQKKGDLDEAVRLIHEAIRTSPDRADLHEYLAKIYAESKRRPLWLVDYTLNLGAPAVARPIDAAAVASDTYIGTTSVPPDEAQRLAG